MSVYRPPIRLIDAINNLGLASGLQLCLDSGDAASYTSGQKWLDRSANGNDFFLGTSSTSEAVDPLFNGTPGSLSATNFFESTSGTAYFQYDTANEDWMNRLHQDNAKWSFACWFYMITSTAASQALMGTNQITATNVGISIDIIATTLRPRIVVANGTGAFGLVQNSTVNTIPDAWNFSGISFDESVGASGIKFVTNTAISSGTSTITTPSTANATFTMNIWSVGGGVEAPLTGSRIGMLAMWDGVALTREQLSALNDMVIISPSMGQNFAFSRKVTVTAY